MKFIKLFFWSFLTLILVLVLDSSFKIGDSPIPAIGPLFNPMGGFWQNAENVNHYEDKTLQLDGLKEDIQIKFDQRMVPHIFANSMEDALFAQGYVEAYHRLFQMDISTRSSSGRLAEIFGKTLVDRDLSSRRLGMGFAADNAVKGWKKHPQYIPLAEAYTKGVNSYIDNLDTKDYPMEYKLLGFKPEPWSILKSAYMQKAMSLVLCGYERDVANTNALKYLGPEDFNFVYPEYDPKNDPIIPKGTEWNIDTSSLISTPVYGSNYDDDIDRFRSPKGIGSNNWAVNGTKTASGKPILASDPHLELSLPSVWYELHIHTPEFSAYGVTLLGMPGIMIGFNQDIAWGETNVGHDVMDWHRIKWSDSSKETYLMDGKNIKVAHRIEEIKVKNGETIFDTVKYTVWGPVAKDTANQHKDLALQWISHLEPTKPEFIAFVKGMTAQNYDQYLEATANFESPAQNFAFADRHGEIGIRINGTLPIKKKGQGRMISEGDSSDDGWQGFIPRDKNPQTRNPERGYISSANQWSTDETYPYYYNGNFEAFRGRQVNRLLDSMSNIEPQDMMSMQMNSHSIKAEESLPQMLKALNANNANHQYAKILQQWDHEYKADAEAPIIYNYWWKYLHNRLWDEVKDKNIELRNPEEWRTIAMLENEPTSKYWDDKSTSTIENMADIINQSFEKTIDQINKIKDQKGGLAFQKHRTVTINHPTRIPALSVTGIVSDGYEDALNAIRPTTGPSWRMVVALGDTPQAYGIYPGGQSGNPGSAFYKNMIPDWTIGQHQTLLFPQSMEEMKDNTLFTIQMTPHAK